MKNILKTAAVFFIVSALQACGGGGGDARAPVATPTGGGAPQITVTLQDASSNALASNTIGNDQNYYVVSQVLDASAKGVPAALVQFSVSDASVGTLTTSLAITDLNGVAKVRITPAGLSGGVAVVTASTTVGTTTAISSSLNFQTASTMVTLVNMAIAPATVSAYQNALVTVNARIPATNSPGGTVSAPANSMSANFSATCGTFSPATAVSVDTNGAIKATYIPITASTGVPCSGAITATAAVVGQPSVSTSTTINVTPATASAMNFKGASVPLLVAKSVGGQYSRSLLTFQLLDDQGRGTTMASKTLVATLSDSSKAAGITFTDGTTNDQTLTTLDDGTATVTVVSGDLFSSVLVTAKYTPAGINPPPPISATSYGVAVTSGKATQDRFSVSAAALSMEAWNVDGVTNSITVRVSDRLGNPLPPGTIVNFASNNGVITGPSGSRGTCALNDLSTCTVTYTSTNGNSRPPNGRIAILAYMSGEESFVDFNGDNLWQPGETFYPIGRPYLDANESGTWNAGEQLFGTTDPGAGSCDGSGYPSKLNTCDVSAWSGDVLVRKQIIVVQATSGANITQVSRSTSLFEVKISDMNDATSPPYKNSMPSGSSVSASVRASSGGTCGLLGISSDRVPNQTDYMTLKLFLNGAADCASSSISVTVTAPSGLKTTVTF